MGLQDEQGQPLSSNLGGMGVCHSDLYARDKDRGRQDQEGSPKYTYERGVRLQRDQEVGRGIRH